MVANTLVSHIRINTVYKGLKNEYIILAHAKAIDSGYVKCQSD